MIAPDRGIGARTGHRVEVADVAALAALVWCRGPAGSRWPRLRRIDLFGVGEVCSISGAFNVAAWVGGGGAARARRRGLEDIENHLQDGNFRPADFAKS